MARFVRPCLEKEKGEFIRVEQEEGVPLEPMMQAAKVAPLHVLTDEEWRTIRNTESCKPSLTIAEVRRFARDWTYRDVDRIEQGFRRGDPMPAPIVLVKPDGEWTCVAGNTRLSVARAIGIQPTVLLIKMLPLPKDRPV